MSSGDNVTLKYLVHADPAVVPANDVGWVGKAYVEEDFSDNITGDASSEIAAHADATSFDYGAKRPSGGITALFREDDDEDFITGFMGAEFVTDVCSTGKERKYFAFEKEFTDMTGNKFIGFSGLEVDAWEYTLQFSDSASESRITSRFDFMGRSALGAYAASQVGTGTVTAADSSALVFNSQNVTLLYFNGGSICLSSLTFKGSRSKEGFGCIGDSDVSIITNGSPRFEVSFEGYLTSGTRAIYEEAFAGNNGSVSWTLNTPTPKSYDFAMGKCGLLPTTPMSAGQGNENLISGTFIPVHNDGTAAVTITRA